MATERISPVEGALRKVFMPVCVLSGVLVMSGFFFPSVVGSVVTGQGWLVASLLFFGSGLGYVALLPVDVGDERDVMAGLPYLVRIRHLSVRETIRDFGQRQDPVTFGIPVAVVALFLVVQVLAPSLTAAAVATARRLLLRDLNWLFLGAVFLSVAYCLFLLIGPWGHVKLGGDDATPTYTLPVYFAMVFTAGIAAGIVFWGPAEALFHYDAVPPFFDAPARSNGAVVGALTTTLFHWGLSAWSAYAVIGIPIAYFMYNHDAPLRVATILTPFLGVENLDGPWGKLVDVLAVFATIGGVATSVAFVSRQFLTGIRFQWGVTYGSQGPLLFVAGLILIYVVSAESGIHRGIRRIAGLTVVLFALFAALLLAVGPRSSVIEAGLAAVGSYAVHFVSMSLSPSGEWGAAWTVYYWSWWFSWAPFAGLFLAALSKGRRIRTVVLAGVVGTSAVTMVWFVLLGGTALHLQHTGVADVLASIAASGGSEAVAGYPTFSALPVSQLLIFLFLALIIVFITTSADTSTLIVSILATRDELAPTTGTIVFWGVFQGAVALAVLLIGGGQTLQTAAVLTGGPFAVISVVAMAGLVRTFRKRERGHPWLFARIGERLPTIESSYAGSDLEETDD
ncbi:MAG: BCCT family transporter [Haloarculaceae archaeon]